MRFMKSPWRIHQPRSLMDEAWTFINTSLSSGMFLIIQEHQVFRICDKQLLSSILYQVILLTSAFIKLSVSGKADVEYSVCTELTAFAPKECLWHKADPEMLPIPACRQAGLSGLRITIEYFLFYGILSIAEVLIRSISDSF